MIDLLGDLLTWRNGISVQKSILPFRKFDLGTKITFGVPVFFCREGLVLIRSAVGAHQKNNKGGWERGAVLSANSCACL